MTQAIFGLVGVIIGGVITGTVQWLHDHRTRKMKRRAAARLVFTELASTESAFGMADQFYNDALEAHEADPNAPAAGFLRGAFQYESTGNAAWLEHRALLAEELPNDDWHLVDKAYFQVDGVLQLREEEDEALVGLARSAFAGIELEQAQAALARHGFPGRFLTIR